MLERRVDPFDSRRQELSKRKARVADAKAAEGAFEAFTKRWIRERLTTKSDTCRKQIESRLERFIWPAIGTRALNAVRPADVLEIIEARRDTPKTAEGVRGIIQQIYNYATVAPTVLPDSWGVDDLALVLQDKRVTADGRIDCTLTANGQLVGYAGDRLLANGMFGPTWRAPRQWVRLRLLNGCNARILVLRLSDACAWGPDVAAFA